MKSKPFAKNAGVTLLEIILVVSIGAVVAAAGAPTMISHMENKKMSQARNSLMDIADAIRVYEREYAAPLKTSTEADKDNSEFFLKVLAEKGLVNYVDSEKNDLQKGFSYFLLDGVAALNQKYEIQAKLLHDEVRVSTYTMSLISRAQDVQS